MTALEGQFREIWDQLRAKKASYRDYLDALRIENLRGIRDLQIAFPYPVSVIAGTQGCGKSTALMAAACAYKVPNQSIRANVPSTFFPSFSHSKKEMPSDRLSGVRLTFSYVQGSARTSMVWSKTKSWGRSFMGRKEARQPERLVYVRSLSDLANPSEVRSALQMGRLNLTNNEIQPALVSFAQRVLPFRYSRLDLITSDRKNLLFAHRRQEEEALYTETLIPERRLLSAQYSEFHMSGGERSVLRLSMEISQLRDALILIDEIEIALHPYTQQTLMMELQRLALRNNLQIIVTSHSPAIFDTVPPEARIFLERDQGNVEQKIAYPDVLQNAFYGRSFNKLSLLCEDKVSEAIVRGIFDYLCPKLSLRQDDIVIGRNSGKSEFPAHMKTLKMFDEIQRFVFVLDGDARDDEILIHRMNDFSPILAFLPGDSGPEKWLIETLKYRGTVYADFFSLSEKNFLKEIQRIEMLYESATQNRLSRHKYIFDDLCLVGRVDAPQVARKIAKSECDFGTGVLVETRDSLEDAVNKWRSSTR